MNAYKISYTKTNALNGMYVNYGLVFPNSDSMKTELRKLIDLETRGKFYSHTDGKEYTVSNIQVKVL